MPWMTSSIGMRLDGWDSEFIAVSATRTCTDDELAPDDRMTLRVEVAAPAPEGLAARVAESVRDVTKLRAEVQLVAPGSLPNDGKVIEDARSYK